MKKIIITIVVLAVLGVAYWLLSPFWRNVTLDEGLPGAGATPIIQDNLSMMDASTKADFEEQTMKMEGEAMMKSDAMPENQPTIVSRASMIARAHEVSGEALLVQAGSEAYLRFENLKTINGPDLRIYLGAGLNTDDFVDLGPIRATEGNVNYAIPAGTDLSKYKNAMIWCRTFGVLFSYASL